MSRLRPGDPRDWLDLPLIGDQARQLRASLVRAAAVAFVIGLLLGVVVGALWVANVLAR